MEVKKDWWRYAILAGVVVGLIWWRNRGPEAPASPTKEEQVAERANKFLEDSGIALPEGVARTNLEDVTGGMATGVATINKTNGTSEVMVLAGIPDEKGIYVAWLMNEAGQYKRLGRLVSNKGGMTLSFTGKDLSSYKTLIVSKEEKIGNEPTEQILKGTLTED